MELAKNRGISKLQKWCYVKAPSRFLDQTYSTWLIDLIATPKVTCWTTQLYNSHYEEQLFGPLIPELVVKFGKFIGFYSSSLEPHVLPCFLTLGPPWDRLPTGRPKPRFGSRTWQYAVEKDRFKTSKTTQLSEMWVAWPERLACVWRMCIENNHQKRKEGVFCVSWIYMFIWIYYD